MATVEMTKGGKTAYINSTAEDLARATADGWRRVDGGGGKSESDVIKLAAMGSLNGFNVSVVDALPSKGQAGVMYFIPDSDERYVYLADSKRYEKLVFSSGGGTGSSGSAGTSNYNDLANKPKIAGVTLEGNKTAEDLSLATLADIPERTSELENDSDFITAVQVPVKTSELTNDSGFITNDALATKADKTHSHAIADVTGLDDALADKADDADIPLKTSDLQNDSGYITAADIPTPIDAYTKAETDSAITTAISGVVQFKAVVVAELPATGEAGTVYFVPNGETTGNDRSKEYIYVNGRFELIGSASIDLTQYAKTADVNTAIAQAVASETSARETADNALGTRIDGKADATHSHTQAQITGLDTALNAKVNTASLARVATSGSYNDLENKPTIPDAVIVDSAMSATSTHAIENKAVHSALAGKANASDITGLQDALNDKVDASLLQVEQSAREAEDNSLLSLINAIHSLVNTDETKLASLEAKVANRG